MRALPGWIAAAFFASVGAANAQAPDLTGVWVADFATPMERPSDVKNLVVPADKAADLIKSLIENTQQVYDPDLDYFLPDRLLEMNGELRSSWIVEPNDGHLPLTRLAKLAGERTFEDWKHAYDNPEERPGSERCVTSLGHAPLQARSVVIPYEFIQTPEAIVIVTEDTDGTRIVDLTGHAPPAAVTSRTGYSSGRWDGDTLVVTTTHLSASDPTGVQIRDAVILSDGSIITEKFRRLSDSALHYEFTVADPGLYTRDWRAEILLRRIDGRIYEYACHEGNRGMENILLAARVGRQPPAKR
jgi:hypothetical protein